MNEIPESMAEVDAIVAAHQGVDATVTTDGVITAGLTNWAQYLLDEGFEGSYFTPRIDGGKMTITGVNGVVGAEIEAPADQTYTDAFKASARGTLNSIQNALRKLIDTHKLVL